VTATTSCVPGALHVSPRRHDVEALPWVRWDGGRFRVSLSTCTLCRVGVMYELGTVGGSDRIRRTGLTSGRVHVTVPSTRVVTMARWAALLAGQAI
jgi:hypothetical protein